MDIVLYDEPLKLEMIDSNLFVNGNQHPKSTRTVSQIVKTLRDQKISMIGNMDVYYMYRAVYKKSDIRFDVTMIPAGNIGEEYPKTHGHYHPKDKEGIAYPELYQVLEGKAVFILQRRNRSGSVDVIHVNAEKGDVIVFPPDYGHISVNRGEKPLILANLVYDKFESLYDEYAENHGAAYYFLAGGAIEQNTNYIIQKTETLTPKQLNERYGCSCNDLLKEFCKDPEKFKFLETPSLMNKK
ncbi:glucose-6-phosphate isomerase [Candidatus Micrarchaeota archaeon]|nr:glucose-6-phosphate isomerase [Candidatus Micrarchaeota archaeon]